MSTVAVLGEWSDAPFAHPPIAPATGPFSRRPFLEAWWRQIAGDDQLVLISADSGALTLRVAGDRVMFCGDADLTDYHTPLGDPLAAIDAAAERFSGHAFSFDSLPAEAAAALHSALDAGGHPHRVTRESVTAIVELPAEADAWLARLDKKDRHEVRRKQRTFARTFGEPHLERRTDPGAMAIFADLHRSAAGAKGGFMTREREAFFAALVDHAGASVDLLVTDGGPVSAAFGFAQPDGYYLYNSAYAPAAASASPGIVLLTTLIESLIADGVPRLDLLKGDEPYKLRLGAVPRQLHRIDGLLT